MISGPSGAVIAALAAALAVWWWWPAGLTRLAPDPTATLKEAARAVWSRVPSLPRRRDVARAEAMRASAAPVCALLAVCLDAGAPPRAALREVASVVGEPAAEPLMAVVQRIDVGIDEAEAWLELGATPGYRGVSRDISRAVRSGLGLSDLLRHHAQETRRELATAELVRARAAGVRSVVPLMVCFLPAFLALGVIPLFASFTVDLPFP